jgi:predicted DNA-binding transcriptional regulator YafY
MPSRLRHRIDGVAFEAQPADSPVAPAVIEAVSAAVRARAVLRFDYPGASHPRRTEPHGLVSRGGRWYFVAWDLDAEDWRLFRVDRMQPRTPTGPRFAPRAIPAGDASAFVSARAKGASSHDAWPCTGSFEVRLPAREVAPWVRDGEIEERADDWTRVTVGSWSWHGLLAEIVRFGADVGRLEPAELAQTARDHAARLAAADVTPERDPG